MAWKLRRCMSCPLTPDLERNIQHEATRSRHAAQQGGLADGATHAANWELRAARSRAKVAFLSPAVPFIMADCGPCGRWVKHGSSVTLGPAAAAGCGAGWGPALLTCLLPIRMR